MIKNLLKPLVNFLPLSVKEFVQKEYEIREWKKQHLVKQLAIKEYKNKSNYSTLVETGTYLGDMVYAQLNNFKQIYSIELGEDLWREAVARFKDSSHVVILQGDSSKILKDVVLELKGESIFWLDGHYSAGVTAKGDKECPVYEELTTILDSNLNHIILIDDARCFNGIGDYPKKEELFKYILSRRSKSKIEVKDDIIRVELN
ncbi:hypothetical protein [Arcticibacter eurypsychrophilus]|uniref:hypothetical protein n=1 Tax=Arcticibacter eurypsychrophilus TaxID=1434752 RepID=UPI00084DF404|nr:hypothetical protein [Arcticibacter eurypsychrophilus]